MSRIVITGHDEATGSTYVLGWFDPDKASAWFGGDTYWDGSNMADIHTQDSTRSQGLYRTAGGRWVLRQDSQWMNEQATFRFITDEDARDWLILNNEDDETITRFFGPAGEERGPGRPQIGPQVKTHLPEDTWAAVREYARARYLTPAAALRDLITAALSPDPCCACCAGSGCECGGRKLTRTA